MRRATIEPMNPPDAAAASWRWLDTPEAVRSCAAALAGTVRIGLDTEFMRVDTYWPQLALVQVQGGGETLLIDPLPLGTTALGALQPLLAAPDCIKIMHAAGEDLVALAPVAGGPLAGLFDTQVAAAFAGLGPGLGYQKLVAMLLGVEIGKDQTRTDWLRRPLSAAQLGYAAADVLHLPALHDALLARLETRGYAGWCRDECERLARAAADTAPDPQPQLGLRSAARWPLEQQAQLRRLLLWREQTARRVDRPKGWILDDASALSLAASAPDQPAALAARLAGQRGFPKRELGNLYELLHSPPADSADTVPIAAPLQGAAERHWRALREHAARRAAELDLPPALLAPRRLLEAAARGEQPPELLGWRGQALGARPHG